MQNELVSEIVPGGAFMILLEIRGTFMAILSLNRGSNAIFYGIILAFVGRDFAPQKDNFW